MKCINEKCSNSINDDVWCCLKCKAQFYLDFYAGTGLAHGLEKERKMVVNFEKPKETLSDKRFIYTEHTEIPPYKSDRLLLYSEQVQAALKEYFEWEDEFLYEGHPPMKDIKRKEIFGEDLL